MKTEWDPGVSPEETAGYQKNTELALQIDDLVIPAAEPPVSTACEGAAQTRESEEAVLEERWETAAKPLDDDYSVVAAAGPKADVTSEDFKERFMMLTNQRWMKQLAKGKHADRRPHTKILKSVSPSTLMLRESKKLSEMIPQGNEFCEARLVEWS